MSLRSVFARMTIDLPKEAHRQLKTIAALQGKSMREVVIESIEKHMDDHRNNGNEGDSHLNSSPHDQAIGAALRKYVSVLKKMSKNA